MKNDKWVACFLFLATVMTCVPAAAAEPESGYSLTVYNQDLVLVRDRRAFTVPKGTGILRFEDIAQTLDATSVNVASLSDPKGFRVLEQNYRYDLVSQQSMMERYLGREITLLQFGGEKGPDLKVRLLSSAGDRLVVQKSDGSLLNVNTSQNIQFPELPDGLILKPSLEWIVKSPAGGRHLLNLSYLASGMGWHADYTLLVNEAEDGADLNGWVTLDNNTGTTFKNAKLKLLAGDVNRVQPQMAKRTLAAALPMADGMAEESFVEKTFSEYHLYTLQRTTTLGNNETKQVELLSAAAVPVKKRYVYDGAGIGYWWGSGYSDRRYGATSANTKVDVELEFANDATSGLGKPLPAGKIRVYKKDTDGSQEFLGEDSIDHTPKDERVNVKMGQAFDVKGERKQTDFTNPKENTLTESFQITVKNHKQEAVTVDVVEHLYRYANWEITTASAKYAKKDARTVEFPVKVSADGKSVVTYTVKYWWK